MAWTAPCLWPGETFACLGGGPSLTAAQVRALRDKTRTIAVNDAWRLAPWAEVLYACDGRWWRKHGGVPAFKNLKVTLSNSADLVRDWPAIGILENTGTGGLERDPRGLRTGRNGGYQAINLAVHLGARRILLLGYDMKPGADGRTHWFGDHEDWPTRPNLFRDIFLPHFEGLAHALDAIGVSVVNCTPGSALDVFPKASLDQVLADGL